MAIVFNDNLAINAPKEIDARKMNFTGGASVPYASVAAAVAAIPSAYRHLYLTIWALAANGDPLQYWWQADLTDASLVPKNKESYTLNSDGSITFAAPYLFTHLVVLPTNNLTTLKIGTTNGGGEYEPGTAVGAGTSYTLSLGEYSIAGTTVWFNGLATGTKILAYKHF